MSYVVVNLVSSKLCGGPTRKQLLTHMADKANDDGSGIYASHATLAMVTEIAVSTLKRTMKDLEAEGLIVREGIRECRNGHTTIWRIVVEAIELLPDLASAKANRPKRTRSILNPVQIEPGPDLTRSNLSADPVQIDPPTQSNLAYEPSPKNLIHEPRECADAVDLLGEAAAPSKPTRKPKPKRQLAESPGPEFEAVWRAWPKKREKPKAIEEWREWALAVPANGKPPAGRIQDAAMAYLQDPGTRRAIASGERQHGDRGQFLPTLGRWLRDDMQTWLERSHSTGPAPIADSKPQTRWNAELQAFVDDAGRVVPTANTGGLKL
jgi:hypothetical protein